MKFTGIIDSFRKERNRHIYHVTYSEDEEEWCQRELRDGYVLGLGTEIETQWKKLKETRKEKDVEDRDLQMEEVASDGEGSRLYGTSSEEKTFRPKLKRRKVVTVKRAPKRTKQLEASELSGLILPQAGDKSVAGEAFGKLTAQQKSLVAANVNKKNKKVRNF